MLLDRKPFVYLWGPFYRFWFDGIVWPFIGRVKAFYFAESHAQLQSIQSQLTCLENINQRLGAVENRVEGLMQQASKEFIALQNRATAFEGEQRQQWNAFEQLYLCQMSDRETPLRVKVDQLLAAMAQLEQLHDSLASRLEELQAEYRKSLTDAG